MKHCPACLEPLPDDAQFCGVCGFRQGPLRAEGAARQAARAVLSPDPDDARDSGDGDGDDESTKRRSPTPELAWQTTERGVVPPHRKDEPARQLRRFPLKVRVGVNGGHAFFKGTSENISVGGIFIATDDIAELGEEFELRFTLPLLDRTQRARGVVVWQRDAESEEGPRGIGLRFVALSSEVEAAIVSFIQHRNPRLFGS